MNYFINYALQFLLGGGIIVSMSILAKHVDPKFAALLYAIPIQFTLAIIFIHSGTSPGTVQEVAKNSLFYTFSFVTFLISFYFFSKHFSFWQSLGSSYLILTSLLLLTIYFI